MTDLEGDLIQEWLQQHGPFDAVVDGANVGLIKADTFNFNQVRGYEKKLNVMFVKARHIWIEIICPKYLVEPLSQ